jgi:quinoprotein glucose dehydrogenase
MYTDVASDGTPHLFAIDKTSGQSVGKVEIEEKANYGIMTYTDAGRQYVILQTGPTLTAVALDLDHDGDMEAH